MAVQFEWNVVEWLSGLIYGQSDLDLQNTSFTFEAQSSSVSETDSLPLSEEIKSLATPALWHYMSSPGCYVENQDLKEISSPNIYIDFGSCAEVEFKLDGDLTNLKTLSISLQANSILKGYLNEAIPLFIFNQQLLKDSENGPVFNDSSVFNKIELSKFKAGSIKVFGKEIVLSEYVKLHQLEISFLPSNDEPSFDTALGSNVQVAKLFLQNISGSKAKIKFGGLITSSEMQLDKVSEVSIANEGEVAVFDFEINYAKEASKTFDNKGKLITEVVVIDECEKLSNTGTITAAGDLELKFTKGSTTVFENNGTIHTSSILTNEFERLYNKGTIDVSQDFGLDSRKWENYGSIRVKGKELTATIQELKNFGDINAEQIKITAQNAYNEGEIRAGDFLELQSKDLENKKLLYAKKKLALNTKGEFKVSGDESYIAAEDISVAADTINVDDKIKVKGKKLNVKARNLKLAGQVEVPDTVLEITENFEDSKETSFTFSTLKIFAGKASLNSKYEGSEFDINSNTTVSISHDAKVLPNYFKLNAKEADISGSVSCLNDIAFSLSAENGQSLKLTATSSLHADKIKITQEKTTEALLLPGTIKANMLEINTHSNIHIPEQATFDVKELFVKFLTPNILTSNKDLSVQQLKINNALEIILNKPLSIGDEDINSIGGDAAVFESQRLILNKYINSKRSINMTIAEQMDFNYGSALFTEGRLHIEGYNGKKLPLWKLTSSTITAFQRSSIDVKQIVVDGLTASLKSLSSTLVEADGLRSYSHSKYIHDYPIEVSGLPSTIHFYGGLGLKAGQIDINHSVFAIHQELNADINNVVIRSTVAVKKAEFFGNCPRGKYPDLYYSACNSLAAQFNMIIASNIGCSVCVIAPKVYDAAPSKFAVYGNVTGRIGETKNQLYKGYSDLKECEPKNHGDYLHCYGISSTQNNPVSQYIQYILKGTPLLTTGIGADLSPDPAQYQDVSKFLISSWELTKNALPYEAMEAGKVYYLYENPYKDTLENFYNVKFSGASSFVYRMDGNYMGPIFIMMDPFIEQQIVKAAYFAQTADEELPAYNKMLLPKSQEEAYHFQNQAHEALYKVAIEKYQMQLGLKLGQELSQGQFQQLQEPIIWLVYKQHEHFKKMLTPYLYVPALWIKNSDRMYGSIIELNNADVDIDHLTNTGLLKITGHATIRSKNFINFGTVKIDGHLDILSSACAYHFGEIKGDGSLSIETVKDLVIATILCTHKSNGGRYNMEYSKIFQESTINIKGRIHFKVGNEYHQVGAKVRGQEVEINAGGDIAVVPLSIYNELTTWGKKYYSSYKELAQLRSEISAEEGSVKLTSDNNILLNTPIIESKQDVELQADKKILVQTSSEFVEVEQRSSKKNLVSKKTRYEYNLVEQGMQSIFKVGRWLYAHSGGDQFWQGFDIKAVAAEFNAYNPEHAAQITMLPIYKIKEVQVVTKKTSFGIKFHNGRMDSFSHEEKNSKYASQDVIPNIIQVEDQFLGYANGNWMQLQTEYNADGGIVIIKAKDIELGTIPNFEYSFVSVTKAGNGIGISSKGGEYMVKLSTYYNGRSSWWSKVTYNPCPIVADFLSLEAEDKLSDAGIYYKVKAFKTKAKIEFHGVNYNVFASGTKSSHFETGIKIGVKTNIEKIAQTSKTASEQDYTTPEGIINGYYAGKEAYENFLDLLRPSKDHGMKAGMWFFIEGSQHSSYTEQTQVVPTFYDVESLNTQSEELTFVSTQIKAYQAYMKAKKLTVKAAYNKNSSKSKSWGGEFELNLDTLNSGISIYLNQERYHEETPFTVHISVTEGLDLEINGHADIKGARIEAGELHAAFDSLVLESMYSLLKQNGYGTNFGFDGDDISGEFGAEVKKGNHHVIDELTTLIGHKAATVVIANALELNGAMIASATRNADGSYTDHGKLTLTFGELFLKHLHGYDDGYTLGMAAVIKDDLKDDDAIKRFIGGLRDVDQTVYATIGHGEIGDVKDANRDINKVVEYDTNIDIKPIRTYFSNYDYVGAYKEIGTLKTYNPGKLLSSIGETITSSFNSLFGYGVPDFEGHIAATPEELKEVLDGLNQRIDSDTTLSAEQKSELKKFNNWLKEQSQELKQSDSVSEGGKRVINITLSPAKRASKVASEVINKYAAFAESHPYLAEYGLSAANLVIQTAIAGPGGTVNAVKGEVIGRLMTAAVGDEINQGIGYAIELKAKAWMEYDTSLHPAEAMNLAVAGLGAAYLAISGPAYLKDLLKTTNKLSLKAEINHIDDVKKRFDGNDDLSSQYKQVKLEEKNPNKLNVERNIHIPTDIEWDKQGKHIRGHKNFIEGKSELTHPNLKALVDKYVGKGEPVTNLPKGFSGYKERFDAGETIGYYVDLQGNKAPTTKGIITYSKRGIHVIPARP